MTSDARDATGRSDAPAARRPRSAGWRDPRIVGGLLVMAVCVLAGGWVLSARDSGATVLVLNHDLVAGATIGPDDVSPTRVRLADDVADRYFMSRDQIPEGGHLAHSVDSGDLLPRSALAPGDHAHRVEVPLAVAPEDLPSTVRAGSSVDVWVLPDAEGHGPGTAQRVLTGVTVLNLSGTGTALAPEDTRQVIVTLPADGGTRLAHALAAIADGRVLITRRS
ncbi:MAG TPA: SAF domain-containing protein [Marmoricola sp.]